MILSHMDIKNNKPKICISCLKFLICGVVLFSHFSMFTYYDIANRKS